MRRQTDKEMIIQKEKTIIIKIEWHENNNKSYSVVQHADLCTIRHRLTGDPWIYIKKRENPGLGIWITFQMNRPIEGLCFQPGNSNAKPSSHSEGECGEGFSLVNKIEPHAKDGWWDATVQNNAETPKSDDEHFKLTIFPENLEPFDPRVYNHGHVGGGGLGCLLGWLPRLFGRQ